jgi:hypothetical protein
MKVHGKLIARLKEDGETIVVPMPIADREVRTAAELNVFFVTDHYVPYPMLCFAAYNREVHEAAVFHLSHYCERPYYFGIDSVSDASSENAEQFLHRSAELVEAVATQPARSKSPTLTPVTQHRLLRHMGRG